MTLPAVTKQDDELAAQGTDLHDALTSFLDHRLRALDKVLDEAPARLETWERPERAAEKITTLAEDYRALLGDIRATADLIRRAVTEPPASLTNPPIEQISWLTLSAALTRDEAAGRAMWTRVLEHAGAELANGRRSAIAVEPLHSDPLDRARFLALRAALADGLQPRNRMEWVLIDGMAQAWSMNLHWLRKHTLTEHLDAQGLRRDVQRHSEWQPPRLGDAEAVDRAAQMADRFQRQFLRLMKCFRDGRRLMTSLTVMGGQVNVAEKQVNVSG